jgi:hypothetical protein
MNAIENLSRRSFLKGMVSTGARRGLVNRVFRLL